ncbi:acyltransferase [Sphingomonas sp. IC-11]|uniref:acyltransferase family protein n=1 Tax=Sphingomonas sp. IC-11 TaxID=2898528 RepID=UPI001E4D4806|nr:acyltransferase [Sphingomonas sp. IC-11]MCD2315239.1 acyltransferase [Sphingomonas sp. IC-11]
MRAEYASDTVTRSSGTERVRSIDALRTIMCAGIAVNHFTPYFFSGQDSELQVARYLSYFTDIFAVLAGLFTSPYLAQRWTGAGYFRFLVTRTARLYPLHVFTMSFYAVLAVPILLGVLTPENADRYDLAAVPPHLTLTHAWGVGPVMALNYPSWMISAIFGCYLILPAISMLVRRVRWAMMLVLAGALALSYAFAWSLDREVTSLQREGFGIMRVLPSFVFGLLLGQAKIHGGKVGSSLLFLAGMIVACATPSPLEGASRFALIYTLVYAVLRMDKAQVATPFNLAVLQSLGKLSFGVYLWHGLVATVLYRIVLPRALDTSLIRVGDVHPMFAYGLIAAGVAVAFVLAAISLRTIEPYGAALFRRAVGARG